MRYEKPLRSAGLVTAGLICLVVGALAFVLGGGGKEQDSVLFAALAALAGLALGITGVWRFLSALDGLALHHWESVRAAGQAELEDAVQRRRDRAAGGGAESR